LKATKNPFLYDLSPEQYDLVSALFEQVSIAPRTLICRQGDKATFLYLLLEGKVVIRYKPYDGPRITLTHLHSGDVFGWSSVVGNEDYTSDALSTTRVETLRLRGKSLRWLCTEYPSAGASILRKLAKVVSPRWVNAERQIQGLLRTEVFPLS
jgi:CRP/FNR family cyclic AMP-dependent transcriptional regulator